MLVTFSIGSPLVPEAVTQAALNLHADASVTPIESNIKGTFATSYKYLLVEAILLNTAANVLLKSFPPTLFFF